MIFSILSTQKAKVIVHISRNIDLRAGWRWAVLCLAYDIALKKLEEEKKVWKAKKDMKYHFFLLVIVENKANPVNTLQPQSQKLNFFSTYNIIRFHHPGT